MLPLLFQGERQVIAGAGGVAAVAGGQGPARGLSGGGRVSASILDHGQPQQGTRLRRRRRVGGHGPSVEAGGPFQVSVLDQVPSLVAQVGGVLGPDRRLLDVLGVHREGSGVGGAGASGSSGRRGHASAFRGGVETARWGARMFGSPQL